MLGVPGERTEAAFGGVQVAGRLGQGAVVEIGQARQSRAATTTPRPVPGPADSMIAVILGASTSNERARRAA